MDTPSYETLTISILNAALLLITILLPSTILLPKYLRLHNKQVLKLRGKHVSLLLYIASLVPPLVLSVVYVFPGSIGSQCSWTVVYIVSFIVASTVFVFRTIWIYVNYIATMEALATLSYRLDSPDEEQAFQNLIWMKRRVWIRGHRGLVTSIAFFTIALQCVAVSLDLTLRQGFVLSNEADITVIDCFSRSLAESWLLLLFLCFDMFVCAYVLRQIVQIEENFGLKKEFCLWGLLLVIILLSVITLYFHNYEWGFLLTELLTYAYVVTIWGIIYVPLSICKHVIELPQKSTPIQMHMSLKISLIGNIDAPRDMQIFYVMLNDEEGCLSFQEFLTKELSVENLLYYKAVGSFRDLLSHCNNSIDNNELFLIGRKIYSRFIADDALSLINVSYSSRQRVKMAVETDKPLDIHAVDELFLRLYTIKKELFSLMFHDSFFRFSNTEPYKEWLRQNDVKISEYLVGAINE